MVRRTPQDFYFPATLTSSLSVTIYEAGTISRRQGRPALQGSAFPGKGLNNDAQSAAARL